ncbi:MAG: hypothetical protein VYC34_10340 [Planctomycetota bacterium]|nr:hypothetical protein [Planctomycetota bacterium]
MAKAAAAMGGGQAMGGMGEMAGMLDQMEMLQQEMNAAKGAMQAIQGSIASLGECMGDGMWAQQSVLQKGPGQNNAGQGQGRPGAIAEADYESSPEKANTKTQAGPIIGSRLVQEGGLVRGESQAEFTEAVAGGASAMAEAIENNAIPREHHDAVKRYFGRLESRVKKERLEDAAPEQQGEQSPQDQ